VFCGFGGKEFSVLNSYNCWRCLGLCYNRILYVDSAVLNEEAIKVMICDYWLFSDVGCCGGAWVFSVWEGGK
jgi:hypothetical protein